MSPGNQMKHHRYPQRIPGVLNPKLCPITRRKPQKRPIRWTRASLRPYQRTYQEKRYFSQSHFRHLKYHKVINDEMMMITQAKI